MDKNCKVFQKRSSLILYILGSFAIIAISLVYVNNAELFSEICSSQAFKGSCFENPIYYSLFGKALLTYFILCIMLFVWMLIKPDCLFYVKEDGFWCKSYGFIKWSNVSDLNIKNVGFQTVICFKLRDLSETKMPLLTKFSKPYRTKNFYIELSASFDEVNEIYKIMKSHV